MRWRSSSSSPSALGDPESLRRFLQEAEVTGRLEHPGVVPIYALGPTRSGAPCYAMRFIRGETLQDPIDAFHAAEKPGRDPSERSLALRDLLNRFVSICSTMAYAHSRGILHRDLKPRNVMLGKYDETLVVDWGLAKPFDRDEAARSVGEETLMPSSGSSDSGSDTPTVGVVGTPAYMSPEQAEARWDIVGPGQRHLQPGGDPLRDPDRAGPLPGSQGRGDPGEGQAVRVPRAAAGQAGCAAALEAICLKAMATQPEDRYATALDLAADVRRWLADEPVTAYAEPLTARARRWMRRHRTAGDEHGRRAGLRPGRAGGRCDGPGGEEPRAGRQERSTGDKNRQLDAANLELAGKNQELDRQRRRAEERETLAIDAVMKFRDAVQANPELKNRPELNELRRRPAEGADGVSPQASRPAPGRPRHASRLSGEARQCELLPGAHHGGDR